VPDAAAGLTFLSIARRHIVFAVVPDAAAG
jgi:hypothetical protein